MHFKGPLALAGKRDRCSDTCRVKPAFRHKILFSESRLIRRLEEPNRFKIPGPPRTPLPPGNAAVLDSSDAAPFTWLLFGSWHCQRLLKSIVLEGAGHAMNFLGWGARLSGHIAPGGSRGGHLLENLACLAKREREITCRGL